MSCIYNSNFAGADKFKNFPAEFQPQKLALSRLQKRKFDVEANRGVFGAVDVWHELAFLWIGWKTFTWKKICKWHKKQPAAENIGKTIGTWHEITAEMPSCGGRKSRDFWLVIHEVRSVVKRVSQTNFLPIHESQMLFDFFRLPFWSKSRTFLLFFWWTRNSEHYSFKIWLLRTFVCLRK